MFHFMRAEMCTRARMNMNSLFWHYPSFGADFYDSEINTVLKGLLHKNIDGESNGEKEETFFSENGSP